MQLKDAIYGRRSIRKYTDKKISDRDLEAIIDAGLWAPSAVNLQPWYYVVVKSDESKADLNRIMGGSIYGLTKVLNNRFQNHPEVIDETVNFVKSLGNADVCILTFLQQEEYDEPTAAVQSAAAGMQNMVLTAYERGIASCWLTAPLHVEEELRARFAPDKGPLVAAVVFGYSDLAPKAPRRKEGRVTVV